MLNLVPIDSLVNPHELFESFDCWHPAIDAFLKNDATEKDRINRARTMLLVEEDTTAIVGFYTLAAGYISSNDLENQNEIRKPIINIAYFAINHKFQGRGYGTLLMNELFKSVLVTAYYAGVELIYLESVDESVRFYESMGFELIYPNKHPDKYHEARVDTSKLSFEMTLSIATLISEGYSGYHDNFELIRIDK